ncbi:phosphate-starvation-inducible PsiE family protein [Methanoregula sp.]|uniref:phosphate-starvation-inducible PsiE family protein n=1 Tax=Methanoregula sp. TaxID=2052170 RepID=UPI002BAA3159|nr:phosphate-starvation-inducible PsiE family protein [Methanoregula sp.]HVP97256.1 phosphate-starvation-inducible PsiE family protein [Methanoregula sp.]
MTEKNPAAPMPADQPGLDYIVRFFALVPLAMYIIVAALLTIIAAFSIYDAAQQIVTMIVSRNISDGLVQVINALLLTITIIVLFETVTVYFRTKRVDVRALLIAGLTGLVRHVLVFNVATTDAPQMFATVALLAVLIAGIVLIKSEDLQVAPV